MLVLRSLVSIAACVLVASHSIANDLVVGPAGSGAPFTSINDAIDVAQPGDRVLVQAGKYVEAVVVDKPIELIGGVGGASTIEGSSAYPQPSPTPLVVYAIPAGARARVANFSVIPSQVVLQLPATSALVVYQCAGRVELSNLSLSALTTQSYWLGTRIGYAQFIDAAQVVASDLRTPPQGPLFFVPQSGQGLSGAYALRSNLWLHRCSLQGAARQWGGAGLWLEDSAAEVSRCELSGGTATGLAGVPGVGGIGVRLELSTLSLAGGTGDVLRGADALDGGPFGNMFGNAASALASDALSGVTCASDVQPIGGAAAGALPAAPPIAPGSGPVTALGYRLPVLSFEPPVGAGGAPLVVRMEGEPGAIQWRFLSLATGPALAIPGIGGTVLLDLGAYSTLGAKVLDATGTALIDGVVPASPSFAGVQVFEQSLQLAGASLDLSVPCALLVMQ